METQIEFLTRQISDLESRVRSTEKAIWLAFGAAGVLNFLVSHFVK